MRRFLLLLGVVLAAPRDTHAAVIFDALQFVDSFDRDGAYVNLAAGGNRKTGNTELTLVSGNANFGYRRGAQIGLYAAKGAYGEALGKPFTNQYLQHLRYRLLLTDHWAVEAFAQAERDLFRRIEVRALGGAGPRFAFSPLGPVTIALGTALMAERLVIDDDAAAGDAGATGNTLRSSSYLTVRTKLSDTGSFNLTAYAQPRLAEPKDARYSGVAGLVGQAAAWLSVEAYAAAAYDNTPAQNVERWDTDVGFKLGVTFAPPPPPSPAPEPETDAVPASEP